jgi:quercetin dioxygenase-like cupin family protein
MNGVFVAQPGEGSTGATRAGSPYTIRAPFDVTGGIFRLIEISEEPRSEAPLHRHRYDESWYVLDGTYVLWADGTWHMAPAETFLFVPAGVIHGFAVMGDVPARKLSLAAAPPVGVDEAEWLIAEQCGVAVLGDDGSITHRR